MACCDLLTWSSFLVVVVLYFVVRKIISRLRIDRYTDVHVFITGCDTGFGNEAAKRFDRMGCHVFAGCFTEKAIASLKDECSDRLHAISLDVTKIESIREAYDYVKATLPKGRGLWGVINNAGIFYKNGPLEWLSLEDYREVLNVNLYGVINVTMTFLPLVKKARGRIVNTASILGRFSMGGVIPYCISKYGVEAFTDGLRRSLRPFGVKAVLIEPGTYKTHLTSAHSVSNVFAAAWNGASAEAKAEYGEEFLKECIMRVPCDGFYVFNRELTGICPALDRSIIDRGADAIRINGRAIEACIKVTNMLGSDKITDVVDAYEEGLLGRYPRARYTVGRDCYTFFLPMQALPEWLGDWLLVTLGKPPLPAALKKKV